MADLSIIDFKKLTFESDSDESKIIILRKNIRFY